MLNISVVEFFATMASMIDERKCALYEQEEGVPSGTFSRLFTTTYPTSTHTPWSSFDDAVRLPLDEGQGVYNLFTCLSNVALADVS
jgi:hypothetical protein